MMEEQSHYDFLECSVENLVCMKDKQETSSQFDLFPDVLADCRMDPLKSVSSYYKGANSALLNKSYTVSKIKNQLPVITEVSHEQSLNSDVNYYSVHFGNFDTESCFSNRNKSVNDLIEQPPAEYFGNLGEMPCLQMEKTFICSDSDDSLGIISDLINDSAVSWDNLMGSVVSDIKPLKSAVPPICLSPEIENNHRISPENEDVEDIEFPVSPCFKSMKFHRSEDECSPISSIPPYTSTPTQAYMKKLTDQLNYNVVPKNYLISNIFPCNKDASLVEISEDEMEKPPADVLKIWDQQDKKCIAALNETFKCNFHIADDTKNAVSFSGNKFHTQKNSPNLTYSSSSPDETYDYLEKKPEERTSCSPPKTTGTLNTTTEEIVAKNLVVPLDKTQVIYSTFSTHESIDEIIQLPSEQHLSECDKKAEYVPDLQIPLNFSCCSKKEMSTFPVKNNSSQQDGKDAVDYNLNATISLPMDFTPKSKTFISKSRNVNDNGKQISRLSEINSNPDKTVNYKKETQPQRQSLGDGFLKRLSVNHGNSSLKENASSFKNCKSAKTMKSENSGINLDLNATISFSDSSLCKPKKIFNSQAVKNSSCIRPRLDLNTKHTGARSKDKLKRRISSPCISVPKSSSKNLNSTVLIKKHESLTELAAVNTAKHFESNAKILDNCKGKLRASHHSSTSASNSSYTKNEVFGRGKKNGSAVLCKRNSLSIINDTAKTNSATVAKKSIVSSKQVSIVSKQLALDDIRSTSFIVSDALPVTNVKEQNYERNCIPSKFKGCPIKNNLIALLPNTIVKNSSVSQNAIKKPINHSNIQKEKKDVRCLKQPTRLFKENSDPNVLKSEGKNSKTVTVIPKEQKSFLPIPKRKSDVNAKFDVPRNVTKNSGSSGKILKSDHSSIRKLQPLQYKRF